MSEEPHPKAQVKRVVGSPFKVGNKVAKGRAQPGDNDLASLRTAMLKSLGSKKDLKEFLGLLRAKDPALYAKLLVQLEPKEARLEAERQLVFVEVACDQAPPNWTLPDVGDAEDGTNSEHERPRAEAVSRVEDDACCLGQGI